jgi:hypothetical protein
MGNDPNGNGGNDIFLPQGIILICSSYPIKVISKNLSEIIFSTGLGMLAGSATMKAFSWQDRTNIVWVKDNLGKDSYPVISTISIIVVVAAVAIGAVSYSYGLVFGFAIGFYSGLRIDAENSSNRSKPVD